MPQILSVSQISEYIRSMLDADHLLSGIAIKGEISNYKIYPSGHHYFTLKDQEASIKCVMFRSSAVRLRFRPENGMKIIATGRITVYPRDGIYQLYCNTLVLDGLGDLHAAFEQLKAKLSAQGLFDSIHKKSLPQYPGTIGIVTSSAGAAVHDILRILRLRYPLSHVRLFPVRVQGEEAPEEIAAAIHYANIHKLADLLIVGRGGGSIEDLWAFNEEIVARAIFDSNIPVISAVGHEPDVTISDYVADLRAATPSNAAELAVPDQDALRQKLDAMSASMITFMQRQLKSARQQLNALSSSARLQSPVQQLELRKEKLYYLHNQLLSVQQNTIGKKKQRFIAMTSKLDAMSPLKVLTRGYAMVQSEQNIIIRSVKQVHPEELLNIQLQDGIVSAAVTEIREGSV